MDRDGHNKRLAYADVVLGEEDVDLSGWQCWHERDGAVVHYYAAGRCPGCRAEAQGRKDTAPKPIESLGPEGVGRPATRAIIEIPVRCTCGSSHGRDGATGCGRRWSIVCSRA